MTPSAAQCRDLRTDKTCEYMVEWQPELHSSVYAQSDMCVRFVRL